jgi:signal transduction histidine kinase
VATLPQLARDALLPAAVAVLGTVELAIIQVPGWPVGAAIQVVACSLLVFRRRFPLAAPTLAMIMALLLPWFGPPLDEASAPIVIAVVAVYALARWNPGLRGLIGLALIAGGLAADYLLVDAREHSFSDVVFVSALLIPPYVFGRLTRRLAEQAEQLTRQQHELEQAAIRSERDRIARELHDVIAHTLSAMVVQTAAAQDLIHADPAKAEKLLGNVAKVGREALSETTQLLHVVRDMDDEMRLRPAPGLDQLPDLVDQFRASGLVVDLEVDNDLPALSSGADMSAYRVVQEALTNALKYAPDAKVRLRLHRCADGLRIVASNAASETRTSGSGLGLVGMGERLDLLGGRLEHGPTADGRYEISAIVPVGARA